jgi:4-aminobutyrate aminotransferase-like enzyme
MKRRHKIVGDVDGLGLARRAEIFEPHDSITPSKALLQQIVDQGLKGDLEYKGKKYGLVLDIGGYYKNVITFAPSLEISVEEIDMAMALLDQLFTRVAKK